MLSFPWPSVSSGDPSKVPIDKVHVNERVHPLDQKQLADLIDSIDRDGLQVPIVVRSCSGAGYDLVSGYHRLMAYTSLWERHQGSSKISYNLIPAIVMTEDMPDDAVALWELTENVKRRQMSVKERDSLASRIQELRIKLWPAEVQNTASGGNSTNTASGGNSTRSKRGPKTDPWFAEWYKGGGIPERTALKSWASFKTETSQADVTPGSAEGAALQGQFRAWCMTEETKRAEAVADAKAKAEADLVKAARDRRKHAMVVAVRAVEAADSPSAVWEYLREMNPTLEITLKQKEEAL